MEGEKSLSKQVIMGNPPLISGPIPPYSNPPIQPQFFQPSRFVISAITLGFPTIVTTTVNQNYVIGQLVRLLIPPHNGSRALDEQTAYITAIPAPNQVTLDLDSNAVDPFIANPVVLPSVTPPQIVAVGDTNTGIISTNGRNLPTTNIPGAFINISPL